MKPILYLDVDGVIAPMLHHTPDARPPSWGRWDWHKVDGGDHVYDVLLSETLMHVLGLLDVEIRWATTWEHHANNIGALFGWPEHKAVTVDRNDENHVLWKLALVGADIDYEDWDRPFIWADDHVIDSWHHGVWRQRRPRRDGLHIRPDSRMGLTHGHVEKMQRYIDKMSAHEL